MQQTRGQPEIHKTLSQEGKRKSGISCYVNTTTTTKCQFWKKEKVSRWPASDQASLVIKSISLGHSSDSSVSLLWSYRVAKSSCIQSSTDAHNRHSFMHPTDAHWMFPVGRSWRGPRVMAKNAQVDCVLSWGVYSRKQCRAWTCEQSYVP